MKKKPVSERSGRNTVYVGFRLSQEIYDYFKEDADKRKMSVPVYLKWLIVGNYMKHNNIDNLEAFEILKHKVGDKVKVFDKDINKYRPAVVTYIDYKTQTYESRYLY